MINIIERIEGHIAYLTPEGILIIAAIARKMRIRGATTKNKRIGKKVLTKAFNQILRDALKRYHNEQV